MGHRAFIIKETSEGNLEYMYSHWGAGAFNRLKSEHYHDPEMDVDMDTVNQRFEEIWEHSKEKGEELKTASGLDEIVDPTDIGTESYIVKSNDGDIRLGVTLIPSNVSLTLFSSINEVKDLCDLLQVKSQISGYLRVSDNNHRDTEDLKKEVRNHLRSNFTKNSFDTALWPESDMKLVTTGVYA